MADSKLKLPGTFAPGKSYLLTGETLLAWRVALLADRVLPGPGISETQGPDGRTFTAAGGGGGGSGQPPAFFRLFSTTTKRMLQGGQVTGSEGNKVVPDIDLGTIGEEPADGTHFYLKITGSGVIIETILYGGFNVTAAVAESGTSLPDNTQPTATTSAGRTCYLLLGTWTNDVFSPSAGGNVGITFCPGGGYSISRF